MPTKLNTSIFVRSVDGGSGTSKSGGGGGGGASGTDSGTDSGSGDAAGAAPSSGYCMDLGNGNTIATASIYSDNRNDLSCSGDFTLAVKNEVPCNKITNSAECGSNKTCTWDSILILVAMIIGINGLFKTKKINAPVNGHLFLDSLE